MMGGWGMTPSFFARFPQQGLWIQNCQNAYKRHFVMMQKR
jgi:hypothetical protein